MICTRLDVSAEPHWSICRYRATTPRCETFLWARIPPHHRTSRSNLAFSVQLSARTLLFKEDGLFWSDSSFAPLFSLWHSFLSSRCLPEFLFIDSEICVEAATEEQESCYTLASLCCLTLSYFLLSTFFLFLLCRSSLKSSSAPLSANVKNLTRQRGDSRWCPLVVFIGWLHVLCVTILSTHSLLPRH